MPKMVTVAAYAAKVNKGQSTVRDKCVSGKIEGAEKAGRDWLIPEDAPYPAPGKRGPKGKGKEKAAPALATVRG